MAKQSNNQEFEYLVEDFEKMMFALNRYYMARQSVSSYTEKMKQVTQAKQEAMTLFNEYVAKIAKRSIVVL